MRSTKIKFYIGLVVIIAAILSTIPGWGEVYDAATNNLPDINELLAEYGDGNLPERYVKVNIDANIGCFASYGEEGKEKADKYYYIGWLNDSSFIPVRVLPKSADVMDEMTKDTWAYLNGEVSTEEYSGHAHSFIGKIQSMDSEEKRFYHSSVDEFGIDPGKYVVRQQLLSEEGDGALMDVLMGKYSIQIIAVFLALILVIGNGFNLLKYRKSLVRIEASVQDYDPSDMLRKQKVVSGKEALSRVTHPLFASYIRKCKRRIVISLVVTALGLLAVAGLFAAHKYLVPSPEEARVYNLNDDKDLSEVKGRSLGELTTTYYPILFYSESNRSYGYYMIYTEDRAYIAELSDKEYSKASDDIRENGKTTLHGCCVTISDSIASEAADFVNERYGESYSEEALIDHVGGYMLEVEDSYNGNGITDEIVESFSLIFLIIAGIALIVVFFNQVGLWNFLNGARYFTDGEFGRIEADLDSPQTVKISNDIYCTDRYIVTTYGPRMFIAYSDILWTYIRVTTQYGKEVSVELQIYDKDKKLHGLHAFTASEANKNLMNTVLAIIHSKNPGARIGYT